ncbi:MAG: hypothetical protein ACYTAN_18090 [Planctomycetota bacterium]
MTEGSNRKDELELTRPELAAQTAAEIGAVILAAGLGPLAPAIALMGIGGQKLVIGRMKRFVRPLAADLQALHGKVDGLSPQKLAEDEAFLSALTRALNVAAQTHQEEKLEALRNGVLNAAVHTVGEEDEEALFLSFVESLTPTHIRVFCFRADPLGVAQDLGLNIDSGGNDLIRVAVRHVFPDVEERAAFYMQIDSDLEARGIITRGIRLPDMHTLAPLTKLGSQFLRFITSPLKEKPK